MLSLRELKERSRVSHNTISRIEDGRQGSASPDGRGSWLRHSGREPSELIKEGR